MSSDLSCIQQRCGSRPVSVVFWRRDQAKGATFFSAVEGETVRPMLDVSWAPFLGAFSVLFEEFHEGKVRPDRHLLDAQYL